jgi:sugar phosphate isomerase/epimerase
MFKNLNATVLGISGRQSELIELAMTYGFQGLDFDAVDLVKRVQRSDFENATRFLVSSKMRATGFDVPVDLDSDDATFEKSLAELGSVADVVGKLSGTAGVLKLPAATDRLAFPEYFEMMRKRVDRVADVFAKVGVLVGLSFSTAEEDRAGKQFKFIQDVDGFLAFFRACQSSAIGLVIDTFDWTVGGGTHEQLASIPGDRIAAVRISDSERIQSVAETTRSLRQVSGTTGTVDNVKFVTILHQSGYAGPITSFADSNHFAGLKRDSIVAKSQDALDHALAGAGLPTFTRRPDMVVESTAPVFAEIGLEA